MTIKFNSDAISQLGLTMHGQTEWTKAQIDSEASNGAEQLINLSQLTTLLQIPSDAIVLTSFQTDQGVPGFTLPVVKRDKDGDLCLRLGENKIALAWNGSKWECSAGLAFDVEPYIREDKTIPVILFVAEAKVQQGRLKQTVKISLLLQTERDADKVAITEALQSGKIPESGIAQIGKGGGIKIQYKPWVLPNGLYKLLSCEMKTLNGPSGPFTVYEGKAQNVDNNETYSVKMGTYPLSKDISAMAAKGQPVSFTIDGAYNGPKGIGAIGYAMAQNVTQAENIKSAFMQIANVTHQQLRSKHIGVVFDDATLAEKRAEYIAAEQNRIDAWKASKAENSTVPAPSKKEEPHFDEIPF